MGRSYHAYLEAVFDQNIRGQTTNVLQSWVLIAITKGVGRDNRMFCRFLCYLILIIVVNIITKGGSISHLLISIQYRYF